MTFDNNNNNKSGGKNAISFKFFIPFETRQPCLLTNSIKSQIGSNKQANGWTVKHSKKKANQKVIGLDFPIFFFLSVEQL